MSIGRLLNAKTRRFEQCAKEGSVILLIIDDQDALDGGICSFKEDVLFGGMGILGGSFIRELKREGKAKTASFAQGAGDREIAFHQLDKTAADTQSQARSASHPPNLRLAKGIEDPSLFFGGDARSSIFHLHNQPTL
jgi:hypothetical protein